MAKIVFAEPALEDLRRIRSFYAGDADRGQARIAAIREAISILAHHPVMGRPADDVRRELVISRGKHRFLALYRYVPQREHVRILRIRHQRELGYPTR